MKSNLRKTGVLLLTLLFAGTVQAQNLLWPIAGKKAGEDILSQPQTYIDKELNFDDLVIGAEPGAVVVCPVDGVITSVGTDYMSSLSYLTASSFDPRRTMAENIWAVREATGQRYTGSMSIRMADGSKLHLNGFSGDRRFQTGQKLHAGDTLGVVDYSFHAFRDPSLMVSISGKDNRPVDPMTPFGLKTTFVKPQELARENPMPADKIREDLDVLADAFCELYPSLEGHMSETAFRAYVDSLKGTVTGPMDVIDDFRMMLRKILHQVPDSHVYLMPDQLPNQAKPAWAPGEFLSFCDDTVRVMVAVPALKELEGMVVNTIDGAPALEYAHRAMDLENNYDGKVESFVAEEAVSLGKYGRILNLDADKGTVHELGLEDGTTVRIPFFLHPPLMANDAYRRMARWHNVNMRRSDDVVFETRPLNDSTAYLGIKTFEMLDKQVEQVRDFLASCQAPNLVIDVRNNPGGDSEVLMRLLSYFADTPMERQKGGYARVLKQGQFASLAHSLNHTADEDIFPEYEAGENGYYIRDTIETCTVVLPDPDVHYGGKVYVLTNGHSFSAATLFPSVLVRNRRGVTVGRETGSGYHSMTAYKFADIMLPNTLQTIHIPLVQMVFDTTVCDRLPEGRGLLPDYPLPLTWNEVTCGPDGETDVLLEYALSLIADGKYLSEEDPFAAADQTPEKRAFPWAIVTGAAAAILALLALLSYLCKNRKR